MMTMNIPASTLLIALALGYIVCTLAKKEGQALKVIGYIIGTSIIVVSSVLILTKVLWTATICGKMGAMLPQQPWQMRHNMMKPGTMPPVAPTAPAK